MNNEIRAVDAFLTQEDIRHFEAEAVVLDVTAHFRNPLQSLGKRSLPVAIENDVVHLASFGAGLEQGLLCREEVDMLARPHGIEGIHDWPDFLPTSRREALRAGPHDPLDSLFSIASKQQVTDRSAIAQFEALVQPAASNRQKLREETG